MQSFFAAILIKVLADPKVQELLLQIIDRLAAQLLPKLAAVIPGAVAAGIKGLGDLIPDIHMPDLGDITEGVRDGVNALLPEDIDIPILSDAFEKATGFDLTDILTGRHH
jgi:hypothetical protein